MASVQVENLPRKLILKRYSVTYGKGTTGNNQALAAGASRRWSPANIGYTFPEGYIPVGITYFSSGTQYATLSYLELQNDTSTSYNTLAVKNLSSSSVAYTNTIKFDVLFAPRGMVEQIADDEVSQPQSNIIKEPIFKRKRFAYTYSSGIAAGARKAFTADNFGFFVPDGYEIFSIYDVSSGNMNVSLCDFDPFSSTRFLTVNSTYTSSIGSITPALGVTFINKKYIETEGRKGLIIEYNTPTDYNRNNTDAYGSLYLSCTTDQNSNGFDIFETTGGNLRDTPIRPSNSYASDTNFLCKFRGLKYDSTNGYWVGVYPSSHEVISGAEYVNFASGSHYQFTIPEYSYFIDKQIKIKFIFD